MARWLIVLLLTLPLAAQFDAVFQKLQAFAESERKQKNIPLIAIALVDGDRTIWQHVSGEGNADTVYRVGSVSKLFTGIAVMQLVEKGKLDLDQPVTRYLPDFQPKNSHDKAITLRQLMSHRSGLVREPPVGHYFDSTNPSLAATVRSLNDTELVYEPGRHTKYSNAGIAVVGRVIEKVTGRSFAPYIQKAVLEPLGMTQSAFSPLPNLAKAFMWTYDGRVFDAPRFELGIAPAGSLYSTTGDLGRFLSALFREGEPVLHASTLAKMWEPQYGSNYGLGFNLGKLDGIRSVSHGGAIYGFATDVRGLPGEKLGAVVIANMDSSNSVTSRISQQALRWMRAARKGSDLDDVPAVTDLTAADIAKFEGRYGTGEKEIELTARGGKLYLLPLRGGTRQQLRWSGEDLMTDDKLGHGLRLRPRNEGLQDGPDLLVRQPARRPAAASADLRPYLGEYGWDHNVLYVLEREGKLTVVIEWYDYYPLQPVRAGVFRFPEWGLYNGEFLTFTPEGAKAGGVLFPRRQSATGSSVFRITPQKPVAELRETAVKSRPPVENGMFRNPELVELKKLDSTIKLDIRYASTDNFLSTPVYTQPRAFLQKPAAEALLRAHLDLKQHGLGLLIHDAYRPWFVTKIFWDATTKEQHAFVADPSKGSRHNRGSAVDLSLYDLATGKPVEMPGLYDEMSERSYPDYPGSTSLARWHRDLLRRTMEKQGFRVFDVEWWHFDHQDWDKYAIQNIPFESIRSR